MAQSRLEKIGTIFSRVTGLLRTEAMKVEDKPIWYNVYAAFPPKLEPRYDRPEPNVPIKSIFYHEDVVRAKYQQEQQQSMINLMDTSRQTKTQQFIKTYNDLKNQGPLDEKQLYATALDVFETKRMQSISPSDEKAEDFLPSASSTANEKNKEKDVPNVDIKDLFKQ